MMPLPAFRALYLAYPIVLGLHNLDECTQPEHPHATRQLPLHSRYVRSDVARIAMILLTVASAVLAVLNYTTHTEVLVAIAELSVFSLLFNAVGHVLLSIKNHAWGAGTRSAALLVLPYAMIVVTVMARGSGQAVRALWPLAVEGLIALPAAILIALAVAKGVHKLTSRR